MKRSIYILIVVSLLLISVTSCNLPINIDQRMPDDPDKLVLQIPPVPTNTLAPTVRPTPSCPDVSAFGRLYEYWPGSFTFPSTWKFTWFYGLGTTKDSPSDWLWMCVPESYSLYLSTGPDFEDEIEVPINNLDVTYDITKVSLDWYFNYPLESLKVYRWVAVGHYGDIDIGMDRVAQLHQDAKWIGYSPINKGSFRTGPQCRKASIDIPVLVFPAKGETINMRHPKFSWDLTSCMPLVFMTQLSRNPDLESLALGFISYAAEDYTFYRQTNYPWLDMETAGYGGLPALPDCTTYYWRVRGGIGDATYTERVWGEWSGIQSFFVNSGTCPTATPTRIPPTKTPTPTATLTPVVINCGDYKDPVSCESHSKCDWYIPPPSAFKPSICINAP
jgi:hypothetical protein